jgi:hypothetical protein
VGWEELESLQLIVELFALLGRNRIVILLAEAIAACHAISFGREVAVAKVILEGDSLVVMSALMKEEVCNQAYGKIIKDIRSSIHSFISVDVHNVKRGANMAAHVIAKCAISRSLDNTWIGECHSFIQTIVLAVAELEDFIE